MGGKNSKSYSINENKSYKTEVREDVIEKVVCNEDDMKENEMKLLPLTNDDEKILLIKQKGEFYAIGTKCTHYGALLNTGALGDGRIRCPWHGACFNIKTGDIEDYPGLDSLPCYKVTVSNGQVKVHANRKDLTANKRVKQFSICNSKNRETVVIVGGGPAGATCAETLRQEGFTGRIVMICKEDYLPYDRIKVSKSMDFNINKSLLRSKEFYNERKIEVLLNTEAINLNTNNKLIKLNNKSDELNYNYVFLSTGSQAKLPDIPGNNLKNIFTIRTYLDASMIKEQLKMDKNVVILGQSFIAMEAAAYCVGKCSSITIIGRDNIPLKPIFGDEIGAKIKEEYESKGIKFISGKNITKFIPKNDDNESMIGNVELTDGQILPADIFIAGIGSTPYTQWLKDSNLSMNDDGTIVVDEYLKTNVENIYAGGDIAYAPVFIAQNKPFAIGHYPLAHYHGKIAAMNICGKKSPLKSVPYFWTTLFGKSYRYAGCGKAEKIKIYGSLDNYKFFAYHLNNGKVIAMSSVGSDPIVSDYAEYIYEGNTLTEEEIINDPIGWMRNKPLALLKNIFPDKFTSDQQL